MSDGENLDGDWEAHHAEEMHLEEEGVGDHAREEEYQQDEVHHRAEVHPREEREEEEVHPQEHHRLDIDNVSSPPEWHHLAVQP